MGKGGAGVDDDHGRVHRRVTEAPARLECSHLTHRFRNTGQQRRIRGRPKGSGAVRLTVMFAKAQLGTERYVVASTRRRVWGWLTVIGKQWLSPKARPWPLPI